LFVWLVSSGEEPPPPLHFSAAVKERVGFIQQSQESESVGLWRKRRRDAPLRASGFFALFAALSRVLWSQVMRLVTVALAIVLGVASAKFPPRTKYKNPLLAGFYDQSKHKEWIGLKFGTYLNLV